VLSALRRDLTIGFDDDANPADALQEVYGARPDEEFIREAWPTLLESWLPTATEARQRIAHALQEAHHDKSVLRGRGAQLAYLRDLRNAKLLREVVWEEFVAAGEPERASEPSVETVADISKDETKTPDRQLEKEVAKIDDSALTLVELERRLWDAANALRGPVDPADFKNYVFPILFWKWISDTWEWEHHQAVEEMGHYLSDEIEADYHRFRLPDGTRWSEVIIRTDNIGSRVQNAFGQIEQANAGKLAGIFGDAAWGNKERLPEKALVSLLNAFNSLNLSPERISHDMLGQAYEYLLKNFADESGQKAGEFFTPRRVVHLLVEILQPKPEESIYDPAAGSGGMLVDTINNVRDHGGDHRTLRLYAQEVNLTTAAIAKMNLYLHEIEEFKVVRGNTLQSPAFREPDGSLSTFDVVIANPPFSLQNWGADTWYADPRSFCGIPPAKTGDYAWVQHMVYSMKKLNGRVGVVMPHGVLFRGGVEAKIRQCLVERDELEAVIGLPKNLFYSTTIPACLLIFRAVKPLSRRHHVLFVDGSARFVPGRNQNYMSVDDIEAILAAYRSGASGNAKDGVQGRLVPLEEIKDNGFDLSIGLYVSVEVEQALSVEIALAAYEDARRARMEAERRMLQKFADAGIADWLAEK
jgi:type I restriction enzyme M protein